MVVAKQRSILKGLQVQEVMRRRVVRLAQQASLSLSINLLVKNKISALLVIDDDERPVGVVSKTDLIGAFYAGLPVDTPVQEIMAAPPLCCFPDDSLESAIDLMHEKSVHRLYVLGADAGQIVGKLAYPDIVGLLYRYCHVCPHSTARPHRPGDTPADVQQLHVGEVMTRGVQALGDQASLAEVIEVLTAQRFGAVLIQDQAGLPAGVISKSDLVLAYKHGTDIDQHAAKVMRSPVLSCERSELLTTALQQMLLKDVQRLFVHEGHPSRIVGVLSLSDSARFRSGSCRACTSSRLMVGS